MNRTCFCFWDWERKEGVGGIFWSGRNGMKRNGMGYNFALSIPLTLVTWFLAAVYSAKISEV